MKVSGASKGLSIIVLFLVASPLTAQQETELPPPRATPRATAKPATSRTAQPTTARTRTKSTASSKNAEAARPMSISVKLSNGSMISGALLNTTELPLKTSFGTVNIPLSVVAGFKMAQKGSPTTTVILHNGDSITGATRLLELTIETEWGKAIVDSPNVSSILFTPGVRWESQKDLSGTRWRLVAADGTKSSVTTSGQNALPAGTTSRTTGSSAPPTVVRSRVINYN
jgi:hypothetical protein